MGFFKSLTMFVFPRKLQNIPKITTFSLIVYHSIPMSFYGLQRVRKKSYFRPEEAVTFILQVEQKIYAKDKQEYMYNRRSGILH